MLSAMVEDTASGMPVWVAADGQKPPVDWADEPVPISHPQGERINLRTSIGLRVWVREGAERSRVLFQFHHACCDGIGALQFIEDLLLAYSLATSSGKERTRLRRLDAQRLQMRGEFGIGLSTRRASLREVWRTARLWREILVQRPAVLAAPAAPPTGQGTFPPLLGFESCALTPVEAGRLHNAAVGQGVTLNDLMLRDMFQVLRAWNLRYGDGRENAWLRINMPTNLRHREDAAMPAANVLSFTFLSRKAADCRDGDRLLASIREETTVIKQQRLGLYFVGGMALARRAPRLAAWLMRRNRSFATVVLSNLGRVSGRTGLPRQQGRLVCGNLLLEAVAGSRPSARSRGPHSLQSVMLARSHCACAAMPRCSAANKLVGSWIRMPPNCGRRPIAAPEPLRSACARRSMPCATAATEPPCESPLLRPRSRSGLGSCRSKGWPDTERHRPRPQASTGALP